MKSIKLLLSALFILTFISVNAQDDFYNDKKAKDKEKTEKIVETQKIAIEEYTTEQDYNEKHNIEPTYEVYDGESEEFYDGTENRKPRRNTLAGEIVAEVVVEVFVNAVFIIAAFWH